MAQLALGIAGAVIGSAFGGIGASIGWSIGAALGGLLDPPKQEGPRLSDLRLQKSSYGGMVPIVFGTVRTPGNVIWQTDLTEHKHKSSGKGGPDVTNYTYSASWAIALCEGPITGILRVWANGRLVWDAAQGSAEDSGDFQFTTYLGDETQLPDPTMESVLGAGEVPAYRGVAYIVFTDRDLTDFGNTLPNIECEVSTVAGLDAPITAYGLNSANPIIGSSFGGASKYHPFVTNWNLNTGEIRTLEFQQYDSVGLLAMQGIQPSTYNADHADLSYIAPDTIDGALDLWPQVVDNIPGTEVAYLPITRYVYADDTVKGLWWGAVGVTPASFPIGNATLGPQVGTNDIDVSTYPAGGVNWLTLAGVDPTEFYKTMISTADCKAVFAFMATPAQQLIDNSTCDKWYKIVDGAVVSSGTISPALNAELFGGPAGGRSTGTGTSTAWGTTGFGSFENNGVYCWRYEESGAGGVGEVSLYKITGSNFALLSAAGSMAIDTLDPGTVVHSTNGATGTAIGGGYFGVLQGDTVAMFKRNVTGGGLTLADIVTALSAKSQLTVPDDIDVTDIPDPVDGVIYTQQGAIRSMLEPLMTWKSVDAAEIDDVIVWRHRGKPPIASIPDDELAAHDLGGELPPQFAGNRTQEQDLPARFNVDYINNRADYQTGTQSAERQVTQSQDKRTISFPVAMSDDEAKATANRLLFDAWLRRQKGSIHVSRKWEKVTPLDVITVKGRDWAVRNATGTPKGVIKLDLERSLQTVYAFAGKSAPSSGIGSGATLATKSLTDLLLFDIPLIRDADHPTGFYAAMAPAAGTWSGASLQKSSDGTTYAEVANTSTASVIGTTTDVLGNFLGGNVVDEMNAVTVELGAGTLSGVTLAAMLNGANLYLIGKELVYARDATLVAADTYTLTGLLRGRFGTEWAMSLHQAGETFAVMPVIDVDAPTADLGRERDYKAVTFGKSIADAAAIAFTNSGQRLKPLSPVHLGGGSDSSGDATLQCTRRTRIGGNWVDFTDVPVAETANRFIWQIWDATYSQCARIIDVSYAMDVAQPTTSYSAAQQVTDFGVEQETIYFTVAQLGSYGIGRQAQGSVPGIGVGNNAPLTPVTPYNNPVVPPPTSGTCAPVGSVINSTVSWTTPQRIYSGAFGTDDVWVVQFTTGSSVAGVGLIQFGYMTGFESIAVDASIALSPCGTPLIADETGVLTPNFAFQTPSSDPAFYIALTPNTTYYVSIVPSAPHSMYCEILPSR